MASSKAFKFSEGFVSTFTDLTLSLLFFGTELHNVKTLGQAMKADRNVQKKLEEVNYASIKRSILELKRKGLVQTLKDSTLEPQITQEGRRRIEAIITEYKKIRTWDGKIYLVTYDIPRKHNLGRDRLRQFLKQIGCGYLQESVWITPYNPKQVVCEFVSKQRLGGTILVSELGKDGSVGEMTRDELIEQVYKISSLNDRYIEFLQKALDKESLPAQLIFSYLSILEDDPQLPFELLPNWWQGDEAYEVYVQLINNNKHQAKKTENTIYYSR